jgi:1L-myo-inositol 1-phosphate cytidylyltransferase / CDP-L-myo-inositol myo-inositolphosphotransferase
MHNTMPKCLILAAGSSRRMGSFKPLVRVGGLPLIERTIATARQAGVQDFCVVTGSEAGRLESFLTALARRRQVRITCIRNEEWELGNGISLLKSAGFLDSPFLLLMGDHVVDEGIVEQMLGEELEDGEAALAVDRRVMNNGLVDLDDVTKVLVNGGRIEAIGKDIPSFNGFDTGVFLCSPAVFDAARESMARSDNSVTGAMTVLADSGKFRAVEVAGQWVDVDTRADVRKAEHLLYGTLGKPQDGFVAARLNRGVSTRLITPLLLRLWQSATPNQVSFLAFATALAASLAFFLHLPLLAGILVHTASLLDGSDGEVARLKKLQSRFGGFLDAVLDRYGDGFILFGMFYFAWTSPAIRELLGPVAEPAILGASMLALAGNFMVSYTSAKSVTDLGHRYALGWTAAGKGRDLRLFVLSLGGISAVLHPAGVLLALSVVAALTTAVVIARTWISWAYTTDRSPFARRNIEAIIFDFDGTIADTMPWLSGIAVQLLAERYGVPASFAEQRYLDTAGMDFRSQLEEIFPGHCENEATAATMEEEKRRELLQRPLFPEVIPALKALKRDGLRIFVCSSTSEYLVREFVYRAGIEDLVDACFGYVPGLPKPRQIEFILCHYGLRRDGVVFVGDALVDEMYARSVGVPFIGVARLFPRMKFAEYGVCSVDDLAGLTRSFRRWDGTIQLMEPRELAR